MARLAQRLLDHLHGILNYHLSKVPLGVMEAVNDNMRRCYVLATAIAVELSAPEAALTGFH